MDTKRLIISVTLTLTFVVGYQLFMHHLKAVHPGWFEPQAAIAPTTEPATTAPTIAGVPTTGPTTNPALAANVPGALSAFGTTQPVGATLGTDTAKFPLVLDIDPMGAGLKSVTLSDYYVHADRKTVYSFEVPTDKYESVTRTLATRTVTVDGKDTDVSNTVWTLSQSSPTSATYVATIGQSGVPMLELTKQFVIQPKDAGDGSQGFDVAVHQGFRNLTGNPLKVSAILNGPIPPRGENDLSEDRRYFAGYDDGDRIVKTAGPLVNELTKDKPTKDLVATDTRPMLWVGACSSYFEAIVRPDYSGAATAPAIRFASAIATGLNPDDKGNPVQNDQDTSPQDRKGYPTSLSLGTSDVVLGAGASVPMDLHVFFGPKKRDLLKSSYYAGFPRMYEETLVYTSGWCGFITFSWLITALSGILWFFHLILRDWGLAIIGLVCLVRLLLHPITKKAQVNMLSMGKMAPEIERLKKKYGDNKDELNKAMMGVYKEQGMTPILGCLPMFLQTPIWIALWSALQSTFELRQAGFLRWQHVHLTWISDLSHPDALITFANPIQIFGFHLASLNAVPMLLAVVFFIQQHMQPAPANMTPEQEQQRKMMKWMSLLFPVMLYNRASGLSLYICTSTTIGIIENKIIRDHIKQRDEAEKSGKVIVDAGSKKRKGGDNNTLTKTGKTVKPTGITGWIADLKAKAEQMQREAERRGKDRA